jgi:hypothetical protein
MFRRPNMTKIQIELPEATPKAASDAGLLTPQALERLLTDALKRREASNRCRWKRSTRR